MADDLTETNLEETEELTAADVLNVQQYKVCGMIMDASFTYDELGA